MDGDGERRLRRDKCGPAHLGGRNDTADRAGAARRTGCPHRAQCRPSAAAMGRPCDDRRRGRAVGRRAQGLRRRVGPAGNDTVNPFKTQAQRAQGAGRADCAATASTSSTRKAPAARGAHRRRRRRSRSGSSPRCPTCRRPRGPARALGELAGARRPGDCAVKLCGLAGHGALSPAARADHGRSRAGSIPATFDTAAMDPQTHRGTAYGLANSGRCADRADAGPGGAMERAVAAARRGARNCSTAACATSCSSLRASTAATKICPFDLQAGQGARRAEDVPRDRPLPRHAGRARRCRRGRGAGRSKHPFSAAWWPKLRPWAGRS